MRPTRVVATLAQAAQAAPYYIAIFVLRARAALQDGDSSDSDDNDGGNALDKGVGRHMEDKETVKGAYAVCAAARNGLDELAAQGLAGKC